MSDKQENEIAVHLEREQFDKRYELGAEIGRGASSVVYSAMDKILQREIALKILNISSLEASEREKSIARFREEARLCSKLDHPNIVKVFSFGQDETDRLYLGMELLRGETLEKILHVQNTLSREQFQEIFLPVLDALIYAHSMHLIHRDIKPSNIIRCFAEDNKTGIVKLLDFGLAQTEGSSPNQAITSTLALVGTALYMSPEQCAGKTCDATSDVYSLACVMYQALSGKVPFNAETTAQTMYAQINETAPTLTDISSSLEIPQALAASVMSALAKDPAQRPANMQQFKDRISEALSSGSMMKRKKRGAAANIPLALVLASTIAAGLSALKVYVDKTTETQKRKLVPESSFKPKGKSSGVATDELKILNDLRIKDPKEARERLLKLISKFKSCQDRSFVAAMYLLLAETNTRLSRDEEAEANLRHILTFAPPSENNFGAAALAELAAVLVSKNRGDEALALFESSLKKAESASNRNEMVCAELSYHFANTLCAQHHPDRESLSALKNSLDAYDRIGDGRGSAGAQLATEHYYRIALKMGRQDLAEKELNKTILALKADVGARNRTFDEANAKMAVFLEELGKLKQAEEIWKNLFKQLEAYGWEVKKENEQKWRESYAQLQRQLRSKKAK